MQWFEVDKKGLAKVLSRKGKAFAALELIQNAWDQNVSEVSVWLEKEPGSRYVKLAVHDDDPHGFSNLEHSFTLFAESLKKSDPSKRGRFNLGEKLVLALCEEAEIKTVSGSVRFDRKGRHRSRSGTKIGSTFTGRLLMTKQEMEEALAVLGRVLPPLNVHTTINGNALEPRRPVASFDVQLPTEIADADGYLIRTRRGTAVRVFEVAPGETASLYELGIPVVETGDAYHVSIEQKVPLSLERDNVSASYLRTVRTAVLNHMHEEMDAEMASSAWVRDALSDKKCNEDAIKSAVTARFGRKAVAYDPSDQESNKLAVAKGFVVVHGGSLSKDEWENVRSAGALPPAGRITPSPKPFSDDPNAPTLKMLAKEDWSEAEHRRVKQIKSIARRLIGSPIEVGIAIDRGWNFAAAFGGVTLTINRARVGKQWFEGPIDASVLSLLIHELGHHYESDHLSHRFHDALCDLGARLSLAIEEDPRLLIGNQ